MFSGLTNQVSSWMGSAKGEQEPRAPAAAPEEPGVGAAAAAERKEGPSSSSSSPTKAAGGGKLDMLTNVKSQFEGIGGWLGSSIPKLRKGDEPGQQEGEGAAEDQPVEVSAGDVGVSTKDDDDNSSATGGADSGPQSVAETPTDVKEGQFGNVQSKALAGAKSFGSFLYSAVNKAGKTVSEASAKIKETVEKNSLLGDFNKEQEAFLKTQSGNTATALPPWTGCANEEALKEECLSLSTDTRNFVRNPPTGVDFQFDYEVSYPIAMAIMEQDPNLEKMRYELVPKLISEENFWRNYFYRVSLICQANELSFMTREGDNQSAAETTSDQQPLDSIKKEAHEFVSDMLQIRNEDIVEVNEGMKKLSFSKIPKEEEWEKELEAELQDYEVVSEQKSSNNKSDNWEQEIEELLDDDTDLK